MVPMSLRNFQNIKWTKSIFWEDQSMLNFLLMTHPSKKTVELPNGIFTAAYIKA